MPNLNHIFYVFALSSIIDERFKVVESQSLSRSDHFAETELDLYHRTFIRQSNMYFFLSQ